MLLLQHPCTPFGPQNSTPPNSVGIACFVRLAYGTTFLFWENFHYLGNFLQKNVLLHIPKSIKTHILKIIMFLHIVQASSQGIK
jgi:hypothetical protein